MAKIQGPEEFFEAFRRASRPKASQANKAKRKKRAEAGGKTSESTKARSKAKKPGKTKKPAASSQSAPGSTGKSRSKHVGDGDGHIMVRQSTVGVAVMTAVLLGTLAFLAGRMSVTPEGVHSSMPGDPLAASIPSPGEPGEDDVTGDSGAPLIRRGEPGSPAEDDNRAVSNPPQGRYELRLITYKNSSTMQRRADSLVEFLGNQPTLTNAGARPIKRVIGNKLVVGVRPFETTKGARAKRIAAAIRQLKYEDKQPFKGAMFYNIER